MKNIVFLGLISLLILSGCSGLGIKEEKSAEELADDGMSQFKKKRFRSSIESFEKLKDWYPFSKFAILAELKIAEAYYSLEEYEDALRTELTDITTVPLKEITIIQENLMPAQIFEFLYGLLIPFILLLPVIMAQK